MRADKHGSGPSKMAICSEIFLSVASVGRPLKEPLKELGVFLLQSKCKLFRIFKIRSKAVIVSKSCSSSILFSSSLY